MMELDCLKEVSKFIQRIMSATSPPNTNKLNHRLRDWFTFLFTSAAVLQWPLVVPCRRRRRRRCEVTARKGESWRRWTDWQAAGRRWSVQSWRPDERSVHWHCALSNDCDWTLTRRPASAAASAARNAAHRRHITNLQQCAPTCAIKQMTKKKQNKTLETVAVTLHYCLLSQSKTRRYKLAEKL